MKKLIKRKDGSYSQRGLWDNIRANKGSGKKPSKEMLKQESKIKKEENMNSMYKKGGKASKKSMKKESFMEESKEMEFGAPGVKPPMSKYAMAGFLKKTLPSDDSDSRSTARVRSNYKGQPKKLVEKTYETIKDEEGYPTGFSNKTKKVTKFVDMYNAEGQKESSPVVTKNKTRKVSDSGVSGDGYAGKTTIHRKGGAKSMEPGGGGRFAAMVGKLKSKGKSEKAAEGIAASAGRAKYGKNKFQEMAAAGKKKRMGGKMC
jgi:hypothetical protein